MLVRPSVTHHAHRSHRQEHGEGLPDLLIQPSGADFLEINRIGPTQNIDGVGRDFTEHANGQSRARERMPSHHFFREPQLTTHVAHFVLKQFAKRFDELELHVRLEAAHVVVRLDRSRRTTRRAHRLDDIGIQRALHQKLGALPRCRRRILEHVDERVSDDLALLFRIALTSESV